MIYLEILLLLGLFIALIWFLFFSKTFARWTSNLEKRNKEITSPDANSADVLASRVANIEAEKKAAAVAIDTRKAAVADEAAKLDKLSVK